MNRVRVIVAVAALVWLANPLGARAEGDADHCDKNHYILNNKCGDQIGGDSPELGIATKSDVLWPSAVAADAAGNVYFVSGSAVYKIDANGALTRFAGTGTPGYSGDGGPAELAEFAGPAGPVQLTGLTGPDGTAWPVSSIALDAEGNLYIADSDNNRVRKVDVHGTITTVAGNGNAVPNALETVWDEGDGATDGRSAQDAQITQPVGVAIDSAGTLYVSSGVGALRKITPDGVISTIAKSCYADVWIGNGGVCAFGSGQIAVDDRGNVFAPGFYCVVRQMTPDGNVVTIAGDENRYEPEQMVCLYSGDGGSAREAGLGSPSAVAVDADGNLFIAIGSHNCIRKVDASGVIHTIAGHCAGSWQFTGVPLSAPQGVAVDPQGNVIIADTGHGRILKLALDGTITTIAGTMAALP